MTVQIFILIAGLLLILLGANYLVDGASSIAKRFGLSEFIIGVTIVGIGTSAPEMVVSFMSAFQGKADMAIGNIVGSNIFNTAMILGVTALISTLVITKSNMKKDIPLNIMVTVLLIVLGMNFTLTGLGKDQLSRIDGLVLIGIFAWYLWSSFKSDTAESEENGEDIPPHIYKKLSKLDKRDFLILAEELGSTVTLVKKETSPVVSGKKFQDRFLVWMQSDKSKRWRDL